MIDSETAIQKAVELVSAGHTALTKGNAAAARAHAQAAVVVLRNELGAGPDVANVLTLLARSQCVLGDHAGAEESAAEAVAIMAGHRPGEHLDLDRIRVQARTAFGFVLLARGDYERARNSFQQALVEAGTTLSADGVEAAAVLNGLGIVGKHTGAFDAAARYYARALAIIERLPGNNDVELASLEHNLAGLAYSSGDPAVAEIHARQAVTLREAALGPDHPDVAADKGELGSILQRLGRLEEAEALLRAAARTFAAAYGEEHVEVGIARTTLGAILHEAGRTEEAEREYRTGLRIRETCAGAGHPELAATLVNLATLVAERDRGEAHDLARRAMALLEPAVLADHPTRRACADLLGALDAA